jgi:hypothetical protein
MLKCAALPVYQKKKTTAHVVLSQWMELHAAPSKQEDQDELSFSSS